MALIIEPYSTKKTHPGDKGPSWNLIDQVVTQVWIDRGQPLPFTKKFGRSAIIH